MRLYTQPRSPFLFFDVYHEGKRHRISTKETTVRAAEKVANTYLIKLGAGDSSRRSHKAPTLLEFSEFFVWCDNSSTIKPNTKRYYHYGMRLLSFSILANTPIDQIDAELIDTITFQRPVIDRSSGKETGELVDCGKTYSQQALRTLRVMLGQAHTWRVIRNKVSFTIAKTPGRDGTITPEIEAAILHQLSGYRTKRPWLVLIVMMDTGCRPSEVFAMRLEHIDWAGRRIKIPDGKSDKAKRWVGMSERMHLELSTWCHGSEGPGWLFRARTSGSKVGHLNSIAHSFKTACIRAGLDPKLVPYLARHTFGTTAMRETGNTFATMRAMGHASVRSMEPYQHQDTDQLTDMINKRNSAAKVVIASPAT